MKITIYLWHVWEDQWYRLEVSDHASFMTLKEQLRQIVPYDLAEERVFTYPGEKAVNEEKKLGELGVRDGMSFLMA